MTDRNKLKPRRSYTANSVPLTTDLETHEMAINWADGKVFTKNAAGNIVSLTMGGSGGGGMTWASVPASQAASGSAGDMAYDADNLYVCVSANQWRMSPLSAFPTDANWSDVTLLLHCDGANAATTVTDSSSAARSITAVGGAALSTTHQRFGAASLYLDGDGDYLNTGASAGTLLGATGNFTIEMWIRPTTLSSSHALLSTRFNGSEDEVLVFGIKSYSTGYTLYMDTNATGIFTGDTLLAVNAWQHVALVRSGNNFYAYLDGARIASANFSATFDASQAAYIGAEPRTDGGFANPFIGYIDDVRVTKVARYTGTTYTVPTARFPNS